MEKLIITPKTRIYDLLEAYPQLEEVLISMAPQFKKLKNPVLRKTVTKITNLNQAATIGGLGVDQLVNRLRQEVGQSETLSSEGRSQKYQTEEPTWFNPGKVVGTIDIRDMLKAGEQPVHEVLAALKRLESGEILQVIAPFIPAPLIDKSLSMEYDHWLEKKSGDEFWVFFLSK